MVLFVLANVTAKNSSHPGTVSNILFVAFVIGTALLIALAVVTMVKSRGEQRDEGDYRAAAILAAGASILAVGVTSATSAIGRACQRSGSL